MVTPLIPCVIINVNPRQHDVEEHMVSASHAATVNGAIPSFRTTGVARVLRGYIEALSYYQHRLGYPMPDLGMGGWRFAVGRHERRRILASTGASNICMENIAEFWKRQKKEIDVSKYLAAFRAYGGLCLFMVTTCTSPNMVLGWTA